MLWRLASRVVKAKQYLKAHPTVLQSFSDWFAVNCQGFSLRSALTIEKAYRQATANSNTCYSSINNCLKDWKKAHSPRKRFQPPTMERRELLPEAETPSSRTKPKEVGGRMYEHLEGRRAGSDYSGSPVGRSARSVKDAQDKKARDTAPQEPAPEPPCEQCNEVIAGLETVLTHLESFMPTRYEYTLIEAKIGELTGFFADLWKDVEQREQRALKV